MTDEVTGEDIKYLVIRFYCRSAPAPVGSSLINGSGPILFGGLKYFAHCSHVVRDINRVCKGWIGSFIKEDHKNISTLMIGHESTSDWYNWPDKTLRNNAETIMGIPVISKYSKKDMNHFLDDLLDDLTPEKLRDMSDRRFRTTMGIFMELEINTSHPLHKYMVMRQINGLITMNESLWNLIYEYLRD
jgi:hypothetical protein